MRDIPKIIKVLEAAFNHKPIEYACIGAEDWEDWLSTAFDFSHFEYRVKLEPPKPREWVLRICPAITQAHKTDNRISGFAFVPGIESLHHACPECQTVHVVEFLPDEEGK